MAFKIMADNSVPISAAQDAALYDALAGGMNYVINGIANNMSIGYSSTSLNVTLAAGECVIKGRHITNTSVVTLTLSASSSGYLVLRYDSSNDSVSFMTTSSIAYGNINNTSTTNDLVFGSYTTSASGVSSFTSTVRQAYVGNAQNLSGFYNRSGYYVLSGTQPSPPTANPWFAGDIAICKTSGNNKLHFYYANANPGGASWVLIGSVSTS